MQSANKSTNDREYLRSEQYANSDNLNARILIHELFSTGSQSWTDFIFSHLPAQPGIKILALGCGNATQWRANQFRFPDQDQIILTDISLGMCQEANLTIAGNSRFLVSCQDSMDLAFPENTFDFITANHMLYHVVSPEQVIFRSARLLKPEGGFMAATNGPFHMMELDLLLKEFDPNFVEQSFMAKPFNLENGREQLVKYFDKVELIDYPSDLWVTDSALLCAYVFSLPAVRQGLVFSRSAELTRFFQERVDADGGIFIRKQTGIFLSRGPRT